MNNKPMIAGGGIAGFGVLLIVLGTVGLLFGGGAGDDLPKSPADVYEKMAGKSESEQEKAVLSISGYKLKDPRSEEADDVLRKMLKDSKIAPAARAAAITALSDKNDWQSLPDIAECSL